MNLRSADEDFYDYLDSYIRNFCMYLNEFYETYDVWKDSTDKYQPYIYDMTTGLTVKLSKKGEDPHGIMIPNDFKYPKEKTCIKDAYLQFNNWGQNRITSTDWYKYPEVDKVF